MSSEPEEQKISAIMTPLNDFIKDSTKVSDLFGDKRFNERGVMFVVDASGKLLGALRERRIVACRHLIKLGRENLPKSYLDLLDTIKNNAFRCFVAAELVSLVDQLLRDECSA
ncbi:MAG: hypothetical protein WCO71_11890 [Pseudomonadota bacterium]